MIEMEYDKSIEELIDELKEKNRQIDNLELELEEKDRQIESLQMLYKVSMNNCIAMENDIIELNGDIEVLNVKIKSLQFHIDEDNDYREGDFL